MKHNLLIMLSLTVVLAACGKNNDNKGGSGAQVVSANAVSTKSYPSATFPQIEDNYGYSSVTYSFYENGCDTGRQRVSGYDQANARQNLCQRLQDDWAHNGCARGMRQAYFNSMCKGIGWNPR